jgi:hypothetical protein
MRNNKFKLSFVFLGILSINILTESSAQIATSQLDGRQNTITTAVPFLMIIPEARGGAMGDAGVALPNDANAMHWNLSKIVFNEKKGAVSLSYTPWLRSLVPVFTLS